MHELAAKLLENVVIGDPKEAALKLWEAKFSAKTIMDVLKLTENELESFVPRSLWREDRWIKCRFCKGAGGHTESRLILPQ